MRREIRQTIFPCFHIFTKFPVQRALVSFPSSRIWKSQSCWKCMRWQTPAEWATQNENCVALRMNSYRRTKRMNRSHRLQPTNWNIVRTFFPRNRVKRYTDFVARYLLAQQWLTIEKRARRRAESVPEKEKKPQVGLCNAKMQWKGGLSLLCRASLAETVAIPLLLHSLVQGVPLATCFFTINRLQSRHAHQSNKFMCIVHKEPT